MVEKKIKHVLTNFKVITERMCTVRIQGRFFNTNICVHVPKEERDKEEKDQFYEKLEEVLINNQDMRKNL